MFFLSQLKANVKNIARAKVVIALVLAMSIIADAKMDSKDCTVKKVREQLTRFYHIVIAGAAVAHKVKFMDVKFEKKTFADCINALD